MLKYTKEGEKMKENKKEIEKMQINLIDIENNINTLELERTNEGDVIHWKYADNFYQLEIKTDGEIKNAEIISKSQNLAESSDIIIQKFLDSVFDYKMTLLINKENGFDDADEDENVEKINPYDPKLIRVDTKTFSISQVNQMIIDEEIDLSPDFQRGFVWTDITRKSRLIESLLLRIPIPVFYFSQDEDGLFQVVDGVQRLTVINSFLKNEFKLKNLEYLTECNGKWFKNTKACKEDNLDSMFTRRIQQTQLFINIIDPQTPGKVKYDIFKRINTGGKALNNQEIRNCLASASTRNLLRELSGSQNFKKATRGSISSTRMADDELILRFISFYLIDTNQSPIKEYKGGMDSLLDDTVEFLNKAGFSFMKELRSKFFLAMDNAYYLFGDNAFRKSVYINKSLFLGITRVLCNFTVEEITKKNKNKIVQQLNDAINTEGEFRGALSMATNDAKNIKVVYETIKKIIGE
jgi:hypothetical protein